MCLIGFTPELPHKWLWASRLFYFVRQKGVSYNQPGAAFVAWVTVGSARSGTRSFTTRVTQKSSMNPSVQCGTSCSNGGTELRLCCRGSRARGHCRVHPPRSFPSLPWLKDFQYLCGYSLLTSLSPWGVRAVNAQAFVWENSQRGWCLRQRVGATWQQQSCRAVQLVPRITLPTSQTFDFRLAVGGTTFVGWMSTAGWRALVPFQWCFGWKIVSSCSQSDVLWELKCGNWRHWKEEVPSKAHFQSELEH